MMLSGKFTGPLLWLVALKAMGQAQSLEVEAQKQLEEFLRKTLSDCGPVQGIPVRTMATADGTKFVQMANFKVGRLERVAPGERARLEGVEWMAQARFEFSALRWFDLAIQRTWGEWYEASRHPEEEVSRLFVGSSGPLGLIGNIVEVRGTPLVIQVFRRNKEWYVANTLRDRGMLVGHYDGAPNCKEVPPPDAAGLSAWLERRRVAGAAQERARRCEELLARKGCENAAVATSGYDALISGRDPIGAPGSSPDERIEWNKCRTPSGQGVLPLAFENCSLDSVRYLASRIPKEEGQRQCQQGNCLALAQAREAEPVKRSSGAGGIGRKAASSAGWVRVAQQIVDPGAAVADAPAGPASRGAAPSAPLRSASATVSPEPMPREPVSREPVYRVEPAPISDPRARYAATAFVAVVVMVGPQGESNVVSATAGSEDAKQAAIAAVKQWRFNPGIAGQRFTVTVKVPRVPGKPSQ